MILKTKPLFIGLSVLISFFQILFCITSACFAGSHLEVETLQGGYSTSVIRIPQFGIYQYLNPDLGLSSNKPLNNYSGIDCFSCSWQLNLNANTDLILGKDTEAAQEKQAKQAPLLALEREPVEFIGLFAVPSTPDTFISVYKNGQIGSWNLISSKYSQIFPAGEPASAADFFAPMKWIAVAQDTQVSIFDIEHKRRLAISPRLGTKSSSLSFSADGKSLLIGGEDGKVYRWILSFEDSEKNREIAVERYIGHSSSITALVYHPYNRFFFSADSFGLLSAWQTYDKDLFAGLYDKQKTETNFYAESGNRVTAKSVNDATILHLRISSNGQNLFAALQDGRVEWYLVRGLKKVVIGKLNSGASYDLQLSPDASSLASIARDGKLRVWKLNELAKGQAKQIEKESEIFKFNELKADSLGYFSLTNEIYLPLARKLVFLGADRLVVAEESGRLLEVKL